MIPIADLQRRVRAGTPVHVPELGAFWCGAVGYFSYDVVRTIERLPVAAAARRRRAGRDVRLLAVAGDPRQPAWAARIVVAVPVRATMPMTQSCATVTTRRSARSNARRAIARALATSRRSRSRTRRQPASGTIDVRARRGSSRRRAHQGIHPGRRLLPGAARAAHRACRTTSRAPTCIARCAR